MADNKYLESVTYRFTCLMPSELIVRILMISSMDVEAPTCFLSLALSASSLGKISISRTITLVHDFLRSKPEKHRGTKKEIDSIALGELSLSLTMNREEKLIR